MAHDIHLIGIDLDGTLLREDQSVSERNRRVLKTCLDQGVQIYLITGRPYCFSRHIAHQIDDRIQVISSNGGIYEIGNRLIQHTIDAPVLAQVIDILQDSDMKAFFKGRHEFYTHEPYDRRFLYDHDNDKYQEGMKVHSTTDLSWSELKKQVHDIVKVLVYHMDEAQLLKARKRIGCLEHIEVTDYQRISFDINAKRVNKGNIIRQVLQEYGYTKDQFMAIGDGNNDIPMFEEAGIRVAMGNAQDQVKACCDYVSSDYMQDGVAEAIEHFITLT